MSKTPPAFSGDTPVATEEVEAPQKPKKRGTGLIAIIGYLAIATLFVYGVWIASNFGIQHALKGFPDYQGSSDLSAGEILQIGNATSPVYLAETKEGLRRFFLTAPSRKSRAQVKDLESFGVRRVFGQLEVTVQEVRSETLRILIDSGALRGTEHWIHQSQIRKERTPGTVISPVPEN